MNVSGKHLLACAILLALGHTINAEYDFLTYCSQVASGYKLPSIDDCQSYYVCGRTTKNNLRNIPTATKLQCDIGQKFDKDTQSCRNKDLVNCFIGEAPTCDGKDEAWIPIMDTCRGYHYCKNGKLVGSGECPVGSKFDVKENACVNIIGECEPNTAEKGREFSTVCSIMKPNMFFGTTTACNEWQRCTSGKLEKNTCDKKFGAFVVETNQCGYVGKPEENVCGRVTGVDIQPDGENETPCSPAEDGKLKSSDSKCSRFFTCTGGVWKINNCGVGNYFDIKLNGCVARSKARPNPKCNRCEFFTRKAPIYWANTVDSTCRGFVRCNEGAQMGSKKTCNSKQFYSEPDQSCIELNSDPSNELFETYKKENGACAVNNDGGDCSAICKAFGTDATKCIPTGPCQCDFNKGACADCSTASDCDSCKKTTDLTDCKKPNVMECVVNDGKCVYCKATEEALGNECVNNDPCKCEKIIDLSKCITEGNCECGINNGECTVCANPDDCDLCKEPTDSDTCTEDENEECYVNADKQCIYCESGTIATEDECVDEI